MGTVEVGFTSRVMQAATEEGIALVRRGIEEVLCMCILGTADVWKRASVISHRLLPSLIRIELAILASI